MFKICAYSMINKDETLFSDYDRHTPNIVAVLSIKMMYNFVLILCTFLRYSEIRQKRLYLSYFQNHFSFVFLVA